MAKTAVVPVRFEPAERDYIKDVAGSLSISEYIRRAALNKPIPQHRRKQRVPEVNRLTYVELGQIGNNLNQIAKACNIAIKQGQGCNIDPDIFIALSQKLDLLRLSVLALTPEEDDAT